MDDDDDENDPEDQCSTPDIDDSQDDMPTSLLNNPIPIARQVDIIQSPYLQAYYGPHPMCLTLDTGATTNMILTSFARRIKMDIF